MAKQSLRMTFPSDYASGKKAKERILKLIGGAGFNHHGVFAIKLSLEEALINAIKHGNRLDPNKKVTLWANVMPGRAEIIIEDEGNGFDRNGVPDPRIEENLEKCSGRGIFLIESYMREVEWSNGGRRLRMVWTKEQNGGPHPS